MSRALSRRGMQSALFFGLCLVAWETIVRLAGVREFLFPAPTTVMQEIAAYPGFYLRHGAYTLYTTMAGFIMAVRSGACRGAYFPGYSNSLRNA